MQETAEPYPAEPLQDVPGNLVSRLARRIPELAVPTQDWNAEGRLAEMFHDKAYPSPPVYFSGLWALAKMWPEIGVGLGLFWPPSLWLLASNRPQIGLRSASNRPQTGLKMASNWPQIGLNLGSSRPKHCKNKEMGFAKETR